jgi:hypothetical protein
MRKGYASQMQGCVNDFNLCADSSTGGGTMPKSKHSYYLMKRILKDEHWRFFTQLMYNKIVKLANKPEEVNLKMKAHEARQQQEVDFECIELLALVKTQTKSEKQTSMQTR